MSDDEGDVQVCDICQEIFFGADNLEQHMKDDHADKEVGPFDVFKAINPKALMLTGSLFWAPPPLYKPNEHLRVQN